MLDSLYYKRAFLNNEKAGGTAFVEACVASVRSYAGGDERCFDASLKLSDCSRVISLDFDCYGADSVSDIRAKALLLRRTVSAFVAIVLQNCNELEGK